LSALRQKVEKLEAEKRQLEENLAKCKAGAGSDDEIDEKDLLKEENFDSD
jgi:hypothetical protein